MSCLKKKKKKSFICELFCRLFSSRRKKFVSKWEVEAGERLDFPIQGRKGKIVIDWGDESRDVIKTGNDKYISHIYTERGIYTIIVKGTITQWSCNIYDDDGDGDNANNSRKLIRIVSYGKTSFGPYAFKCAKNLVKLPKDESPQFFENSMEGAFWEALSFNQSINHWDTSDITDMSGLFYGAALFNQPLNKWDTSNVTDMSGMFLNADSFNQPLNKWDTSNVKNMSCMFLGADCFNQPLNKWDTSNVTNMSGLFYNAKRFNQPLNEWDTSNVTDMSSMFSSATSFNQPLDKWDTSNVTNMSEMFSNASSFNQPLDQWNTSKVKDMSEMFTGATRFNHRLNHWDASNSDELFISGWEVDDGEKLFFPIQGREGEIEINWGDGTIDTVSSGDDAYICHEYSKGGVYTIKVDGTITKWSCNIFDDDDDGDNANNSRKLIRIVSYGKMSFGPYAFWHAYNLVKLPKNESPRFFENRMKGLFYRASSFNHSINHWDTSNITDMSEMFRGADCFNQPLNKWNTSNVTDMREMFRGAENFNQPLNDWDTSNVTDMSEMFHCVLRSSFNQPLNDWDTSNVTNMSYMF